MLEVERYCATKDGRRMPRGERREETSEDQQELNDKQAQRRLMRLINVNFDGRHGDMFVTLTHTPGIEEEEARTEVGKMIKRMRALRKRKGLEDIKYILITECQSGKWHHHLIINHGLSLEEIQELWGKRGRTNASILSDTYTYGDLARYLVKTEKARKGSDNPENVKLQRRKYGRRWSSSKNLEKPEVKKREIKPIRIGEAPKAPKGYRLLPEWYMGADKFGNLFMYFCCVETEERTKAREERDAKRKRKKSNAGAAGGRRTKKAV